MGSVHKLSLSLSLSLPLSLSAAAADSVFNKQRTREQGSDRDHFRPQHQYPPPSLTSHPHTLTPTQIFLNSSPPASLTFNHSHNWNHAIVTLNGPFEGEWLKQTHSPILPFPFSVLPFPQTSRLVVTERVRIVRSLSFYALNTSTTPQYAAKLTCVCVCTVCVFISLSLSLCSPTVSQ